MSYTIKAAIFGERITVSGLADLRACSDAWGRERDMRGAGSSDCTAQTFVYLGQKKVARISYNGRVWALDGAEIPV